jgi:hypothetical protein
MDTTTLMPVALLLLRPEAVTTERRDRAFRILESFLVRRMLCGGTTKNYNRLFAGLVGDIKNDLEHADDVLAARLTAETAPANRWPRDSDVRTTILTRDMYGQRRQDRLVMVLRRVEERLRATDNKAEQGISTTSNLTLEHLIPQTWEPHWPLDDAQDDPLGWRSSHLHKLGNLTLTTGPLNSSLSNAPWHAPSQPKDKRRSLVEHSLLKLNSTIFSRYPESFTEADVDKRGGHLADLIIQIWPGPDGVEQSHDIDAEQFSAPQRILIDPPAPAAVDSATPPATREAMRELLRSGMTTSETSDHLGGGRNLWLDVLEEDAKVSGEIFDRAPVPADAVALRDGQNMRWEKIAARLYGNSRRVDEVKRLYDQAKGEGAAKRSFTGRGRIFPEMEP